VSGSLYVKRRIASAAARRLRWESERFDRVHGIVTAGGIDRDAATVVDGDPAEGIALEYVGQPPRVVKWWLRALPPGLDDFVFIDVGSAKGRVLFGASSREFRRLIGLEYVRELHEQALANVSRATGIDTRRIEPLLGDAAKFDFPSDPLVIHFANPFTEPVMAR
jgi:hypothetical protein